jgi:hypothetical protein
VKNRNAACGAVDQVDDLVEMPRKGMNVLTVERSNECSIDPVDRIVSEVIGFMLERLYLGDVLIELLRILEQLVKKAGRAGHLAGYLREEVVKLVVAWNQLQGWTPFRQA